MYYRLKACPLTCPDNRHSLYSAPTDPLVVLRHDFLVERTFAAIKFFRWIFFYYSHTCCKLTCGKLDVYELLKNFAYRRGQAGQIYTEVAKDVCWCNRLNWVFFLFFIRTSVKHELNRASILSKLQRCENIKYETVMFENIL